MEKNFSWIIIALLTCGLTVTSFTSCGDDDTTNSGGTTEAPVVEPTLFGDWFSATEIHNEDEYEIRYSLISFTENGVMTMRSYKIFPQEIDNYSERMRRHLSYSVDEVDVIKSVIEQFIFFVQPKWKIASDKTGSGNTRNMGGIDDIDALIAGSGTFSTLGEDVFDDYWMNFFNTADAKKAGIGKPRYNNLETYKAYLDKQQKIRRKLNK